MTELEYAAYLDFTIPEYALEHTAAGNWRPDEALEKARQSYQELLPQGIHTPDQYLYTLIEQKSGEKVGLTWLAVLKNVNQTKAWVYDLLIYPEQRRKGYGEQTMRLLEAQARQLGAARIELHVFGSNAVARRLYERVGYHEVDVVMAKNLE
jgi:GNAT superfamily N-acetyltransferase